MTDFAAFALYLCVSATLLVAFPVMMVPSLKMRYKLLICSFAFLVLVPCALFLYTWLGAPKMAVTG